MESGYEDFVAFGQGDWDDDAGGVEGFASVGGRR